MNCFIKIVGCVAVLFFFGCKKDTMKQKVIYESPAKVVKVNKSDSTSIVVADLPIHLTGTNFLLFPVGDLKTNDSNYDSSSRGSQLSYKISNYSEYEITGFIKNVRFQEIGKDSIIGLTDKNILIQSITYLKSVADKSKQHILVYVLEDMDTNKDNKLDDNDIKSLYLSDISGHRFTKVSVDFQELIDWKIVESLNRLYYRTTEDTNKNGKLDKNDTLHYNFIDCSSKEWKSTEYHPI